jgi:hypothetical protein
VYQYRFSKTRIEVTKPMRLTAFRTASGAGKDIQIMLSMHSGKTITTTIDSVDGAFSRLIVYIPQTFVGDYIDAISVSLNTNQTGSFSAVIDDILIEEWATQETGIEHTERPSDSTLRFDLLGRPVSADFKGIIVTPAGKYLMQ